MGKPPEFNRELKQNEVYVISKSKRVNSGAVRVMFIMTKADAIAFCGDLRTEGKQSYFAYTKYKSGKWVEYGGQYDYILQELNITPIYTHKIIPRKKAVE